VSSAAQRLLHLAVERAGSVEALAERLGIAPRTIRRWLRPSGRIPFWLTLRCYEEVSRWPQE
jgi:DNA-binding transcriptional regulator YdaS (Cro superfamily)